MPNSTGRTIITAAVLFIAVAALPFTALAAGTKAAAGHHRTGIMAAQQELNKQGAGLAVDGVLGRKTRATLRSYQRSHGLKASGRLDAATQKALKVS
jgi:peptidoglycan hydrolase-like protein with peptidoglycan-binding domain